MYGQKGIYELKSCEFLEILKTFYYRAYIWKLASVLFSSIFRIRNLLLHYFQLLGKQFVGQNSESLPSHFAL